jgi:hypothetical protein
MIFTTAEKLAEIEREIAYRRLVYSQAVRANTMSPAYARRLIAIMEDIAKDYRADNGDNFPPS